MKAEQYEKLIKHFEIAYLFSISKKDNLPKKKAINELIKQFLENATIIEKKCCCKEEQVFGQLDKIKVFECLICKEIK
jgi:hypothetical protein